MPVAAVAASRSGLPGTCRTVVMPGQLVTDSFVFMMPLLWMVLTSLKPTEQIFLLPPDPVSGHAQHHHGDAPGHTRPHVPALPVLGRERHLAPLIAPGCFAVPFYTFLLRQYFMGISRALENAARRDGANSLLICARIIMPLARPALATVAIFSLCIPLERPDHAADLPDRRAALHRGPGIDPVPQFLPDGDEPHDGGRHLCTGARAGDLLLPATAFHPGDYAVRQEDCLVRGSGAISDQAVFGRSCRMLESQTSGAGPGVVTECWVPADFPLV